MSEEKKYNLPQIPGEMFSPVFMSEEEFEDGDAQEGDASVAGRAELAGDADDDEGEGDGAAPPALQSEAATAAFSRLYSAKRMCMKMATMATPSTVMRVQASGISKLPPDCTPAWPRGPASIHR
jgi:hypothetical protein